MVLYIRGAGAHSWWDCHFHCLGFSALHSCRPLTENLNHRHAVPAGARKSSSDWNSCSVLWEPQECIDNKFWDFSVNIYWILTSADPCHRFLEVHFKFSASAKFSIAALQIHSSWKEHLVYWSQVLGAISMLNTSLLDSKFIAFKIKSDEKTKKSTKRIKCAVKLFGLRSLRM